MQKLISVLFLFIFFSCGEKTKEEYANINGRTMGTNYNVQYFDSLSRELKPQLDSLLIMVNKSMSTYDPNSSISRFNTGTDSIFEVDEHFAHVFKISKAAYETTEGYFNPTIFPLVKYWGFAGGAKPQSPDSTLVDSLIKLCDFSQLSLIESNNQYYIKRAKAKIQLDFSAVAKGYGVDLLSFFLEKKGIVNFLVEIGGEVRFKGKNQEGKNWTVGIDVPLADIENRRLAAIISDEKGAMATSGNYRNYYIRNGQKFVHILDPRTGYPFSSKILSATVFTENCAEADALATALMIGGQTLFDSISENYEILLIESAKNNGEHNLRKIISESLEGKTKWLKD